MPVFSGQPLRAQSDLFAEPLALGGELGVPREVKDLTCGKRSARTAVTRGVFRELMYEWFVQDSWKVNPKLHVDYGLRQSIMKPYYSLWRNMSVFDPTFYNPAQQDSDGNGMGDACQNFPADANVDDTGSSQGRIDGSDLFVLARSFGACQGDAAFDARVDLNPDGCVDGIDLAFMTSVWGLVLP